MKKDFKLESKVERAFINSHSSEIFKYFQINRDNLKSLQKSIKGTMILIFIIIILFEITLNATFSLEAPFMLMGITITDTSLLLKLTPLSISFFYYELMVLFCTRKILLKTNEYLIDCDNNSIKENSLIEIFSPISTFSMTLFFSPKWKKLIFRNGGMIGTIYTIAPLIFIIYSYIRCFNLFGYSLLLISLVILSVFFIITSVSIVYKTYRAI